MLKAPKTKGGSRLPINAALPEIEMRTDAKLECRADGGQVELLMYGDIGEGFGDITPANVRNYLNQNRGKRVLVRIHSKGGFAMDANAIYNALMEHDGQVDTRNDGLVASAAVLPLLAGKSIEMAENAFLMIHDPYSGMIGGAKDFRKQADTLDMLRDTIANSYSQRTGLEADEIRQMMSEETWMKADEALAKGFVNKIVSGSELKKDAVNQAVDDIRNQINWIVAQRESLASFLNRVPMEVPEDDPQPNKEEVMDNKLHEQLVALGMPVNATSDEAVAFALERLTKPQAQPETKTTEIVNHALDINEIVNKALDEQQKRFDAENTRQNEIRAICNKFDAGDLVDKFITDKASVADVNQAILNRLATKNAAIPEDSADNTAGKPKGEDAKYDEAFKNYQKDGGTQSKEAFINSMKVDAEGGVLGFNFAQDK